MRLIIAGSRGSSIATGLFDTIIRDRGWKVTQVVSGGAQGVDRSGETWAMAHGLPIRRFDADWDKHGRAAGPIRNRLMAENADALLALWDGQSRGTKNMIDEARKRGLTVHVEQLVTH